MVENFRRHKHDVPTYGLILLDETLSYVLLVRGYNIHGNWNFPKGKVSLHSNVVQSRLYDRLPFQMNDDEIAVQCAIREVREEIGYDATNNVKKSRRFMHEEHGRSRCFFAALNVPMDYKFKPKVRKEIS
jgi:mRNA-decapping enzyme subunit 2